MWNEDVDSWYKKKTQSEIRSVFFNGIKTSKAHNEQRARVRQKQRVEGEYSTGVPLTNPTLVL